MAVVEFRTSSKVRAMRRAVDFWYKNLAGRMSFIDFLSRCEWIERDGQPAIVYDSDKAEQPNEEK